ncbi:DNA cytosine methyltransferase [Saccharothrix mutabilis subsp. mutabilis]|uniref:DNA (cytosine-5-)-methyltransferase n=1 Tax=Saccharothrix mutabilis subsp. mutabilis TaxID=66855 RepID=A0ABN0TZW3_9PSEU
MSTVPKPTPTPAADPLDSLFRPVAVEFFAGIGLARMGLEEAGFRIDWANDIERSKAEMYRAQFGEPSDLDKATDPDRSPGYFLGDVTKVKAKHMPENVRLAWASSPCVDVSLAGARLGMKGERSSMFYQFTRVIGEMGEYKGRPDVIVLENVVGLATSHGGEDLAAAIDTMNGLGYSVDVLTLDARSFVPQSRPRLFLVGVREDKVPASQPGANPVLRPDWLRATLTRLAGRGLEIHQARLPDLPDVSVGELSTIVDDRADEWWDAERSVKFLNSLSPMQAKRLGELQEKSRDAPLYRTAYRRTRDKTPMWEIRADDIAGCLRTARGGSSKQALVRIHGNDVRVRWMTSVEYARLMGADDYNLKDVKRAGQALFGFGDAVCVPVVAWLAKNYLKPVIDGTFQPGGDSEEPDVDVEESSTMRPLAEIHG